MSPVARLSLRPLRRRERLLTRVLGLGAMLLALVAGLFFLTLRAESDRTEAEATSARSADVSAQAREVERLVIDLETATRAFVLTRDPRFLTSYREARRVLPGATAQLRRLVAGSEQEPSVHEIDTLAGAYVREYAAPVASGARHVAVHDADAFVWEGQNRMDRLRALFQDFHGRQELLAAGRAARAESTSRRAATVAWAGLAATVLSVIGLVAFFVLAVVRPVRAATDAVADVAGGRRDIQLSARGTGELAALTAGVNHMVAALSAQEREEALATRRLEESEQRFRLLLDHIDEVVFQADAGGQWTFLSPAWSTVTGYTLDETLGRRALEFVHPEDRDGVTAVFTRLITGARQREAFEHRYLARDGEVRWVEVEAHRMVDPATGAIAVSGLSRDVTVRREAEEADRRHRESMAAVAEVARVLPTSGDARSAIAAAALRVSGAAFTALIERRGDELVSTASAGRGMPSIRLRVDEPSASAVAFRTAAPVFVRDAATSSVISPRIRDEFELESALWQPVVQDGETVAVLAVGWTEAVGSLSDQQASVIALLAAEAAVAIERADLLARLQARATTDGLTGLANRRVWDDTIAEELSRAERHGYPLCVALLDLDHFKAVNDTEGHHAGDLLLVACAEAWSGQLRDIDLLARWGGEEFAVALPGCDLEEATAVVERLRGAVPEGRTCSAGVALWNAQESADELLARADAALYTAKAEGRDRTCAAGVRFPVAT